MRLTLQQYQRVIARDLESLLNTRIGTPAEALESYPACRDSIVNFGLVDFAQPCLSTAEDRNRRPQPPALPTEAGDNAEALLAEG